MSKRKKYLKFHRGIALFLTENYSVEMEWDTGAQWFYLLTQINTGDHRGFEFNISLFKVSARFQFYDNRHEDKR